MDDEFKEMNNDPERDHLETAVASLETQPANGYHEHKIRAAIRSLIPAYGTSGTEGLVKQILREEIRRAK